MKSASLATALIGLAALLPLALHAAEIKVLASNGVKAALEELAPAFERATGNKVVVTFGLAAALKRQIEAGEAFDLAILTSAGIDDLAKQGKVDAASRASIARSGVGIGIKKGAPRPDIGTPDAFKRTLLNAKSIAYLEDGLTGTYLKVLFQRLGIADSMRSKYKNTRGGEAVANGEVELGVTQMSEILHQTGAELAGPLPPEIQNYTNFSTAVGAGARQAPGTVPAGGPRRTGTAGGHACPQSQCARCSRPASTSDTRPGAGTRR